ncbi:hypothetical protein MTO96_023623 [Rhipicephalus appendiculatus]
MGDEWCSDAKHSTTNWADTSACRKGFSSTVEPLHSLPSYNANLGYHQRAPLNQAQQQGEVGTNPVVAVRAESGAATASRQPSLQSTECQQQQSWQWHSILLSLEPAQSVPATWRSHDHNQWASLR